MGVIQAGVEMNVNQARKLWTRHDIFATIMSIVEANSSPEHRPHPEFIRALICIAAAVGISRDELKNGKLKG